MNPIEKSAEEAVKAVKGRTPLTSQEHSEVSDYLDALELDAKSLYTLLLGRGYRKSAGYVKSSLETIRKARAEQNSVFLREKRSEVESPYYGGKAQPIGTEDGATIPPALEDEDHGDETD